MISKKQFWASKPNALGETLGFNLKENIMPEKIYYLSIMVYEQEISLEKLQDMIVVLLDNGFPFYVRTKTKW